MSKLDNLFENNKHWAHKVRKDDPGFFDKLSKQQAPDYLWIGCSDSRVPANEIVGLLPGEIFVHRNIANVVVHTDLNCLSVIQYAIDVLDIEHIIVCGHYGCGGVKAAMDNDTHGLIDNWLRHIKDVYRYHQEEMDATQSTQAKFDKLCELNVVEQVMNVCHTSIVQNVWKAGKQLTVHGLIYSINNGVLMDLDCSITGVDQIDATHRLK